MNLHTHQRILVYKQYIVSYTKNDMVRFRRSCNQWCSCFCLSTLPFVISALRCKQDPKNDIGKRLEVEVSRRSGSSRKQAKQGVPLFAGRRQSFLNGKRLLTLNFIKSKLVLSPLVLPAYREDCGNNNRVST